MVEGSRDRAGLLAAVLIIAAFMLALVNFGHVLGFGRWPAAFFDPRPDAMDEVLLRFSALPRAAIAILSGASLGLAGAIMQRVLRNPIASPFTLGISGGAQLALAACLIVAPGILAAMREWIALGGGLAAMGLVLVLSWRQALAPITVILAGMIVSLMASAASAALILVSGDYLMSLFVWGGGSLVQQSWDPAIGLGLRLAIAAVLAVGLLRPLTILGLDDASARNLGLAIQTARFAALGLAVWLATSVVAAVGIIGFVGLAAPAFARIAGARTMRQTLISAPLIGAGLLWLTDGLVQLMAEGRGILVPTGAVTALMGGPLLLWLLPRLKHVSGTTEAGTRPPGAQRLIRPYRVLLALLVITPVAVMIGLSLGKSPQGWQIATGDLFAALLEWRAPPLAAAMAAGAMLAAAGTILQRLTGNAMASPEVLGVASGAGLGLAAVLLLSDFADPLSRLLGSAAGAGIATTAILFFAYRAQFSPDRVLLAGVALGSLAGAVLTVLMASGDPRAFQLLAWLTGSTHAITAKDALTAVLCALVLIPLVPFAARWLDILPLGPVVARDLGLGLPLSRFLLIVGAALLTGAATLVVGPLTFVGLMAPHAARMAGLSRALPQLAGAVLIGALLMAVADWFARTIAFPYQLPVGLFAALIGGPYLIWLISRPDRKRI
ncbi:Fe(3+)-hydroxamate ABC transporter permease FhuB [Pararhizobium haloflavum]|uniref:Fe(3+)-hydroxamate ABC transporter permease FhuB n=1 Tax=Pararhizobium haloflavum TaxID=2037914 RepID=UPI000C1984E0|nr:Fe(3+)-hydroxamate ABC transporter permease FhuB [Pararhizobium haloflavum]